MQPKRITLTNVFQHRNLVFDFEPGITGIVGRNGSGKSNFQDGVHFGITGNTGNDCNKSDLLSWDADTGSTVFEFFHNGANYKLTRNIHTSLVKLESTALDKPLKAAEANTFMEGVLGMSFKGFYETCWTPQGTLISILTCSHAVRVAFFQRLAKTREAEVIRGIIQENGINKLPTFIDRTQDIANLAAELETLEVQVQTLEKQAADYEAIYVQYQERYPGVQLVLSKPTQAMHDQKVQTAQDLLRKDQTALESARASVNLVEVPEAHPPTQEMEAAKANSEYRIQYSNQLASLEQTGKSLKESMPTTEVLDPEPLRIELEADNQKLMELKPRYDLAMNKTCPTCHRPYEFEGGEQARAAVITEFEQMRNAYNAKHQKYTADKRAFDQHQANTRTLQARIDANASQWQSVKAQLDALPDTPFDAEAYRKTVEAHRAYTNYLHEKQRHDSHIRAMEQAVDRSTNVLEQAKGEEFVKDEERATANEFMKNYNELVTNRQTLAGNLSGAKARREALSSQKAQMEREQGRRSDVAHTRNLFERAREKLHRDALPKLVMQKMLYGLNALLDQYLSVFDTNFMAYINEDFDFICSFATKSDVPARALSGGQKVALALAFKFAVSDLTASSVPFLVLDEPTVWLDEINKPRLAEVLMKARDMTEKGVYVLVATHEPLLFPSFSRTFDVSG